MVMDTVSQPPDKKSKPMIGVPAPNKHNRDKEQRVLSTYIPMT